MPLGGALTLGIISGAAGIVGAVNSSHAASSAASDQAAAAKYAADLQAKSSSNALDFLKTQWATTQKNQQPWIAAGQAAVGKLSSLLGLDVPASAFGLPSVGSSPTTPTTPTTPTPVAWSPPAAWTPPSSPTGDWRPPTDEEAATNLANRPRPRDHSLGTPGAPPANTSTYGSLTGASTGQPAPATQSGYVLMRAPDGSDLAQVPPGQVSHYQSLGAQIVGGA